MKIKGRSNKLHRVNPNSVLCDADSFGKLKEGQTVDIDEEAASQLLNMGMAKKIKSNNKKKESK
jgi:hypothetical protein